MTILNTQKSTMDNTLRCHLVFSTTQVGKSTTKEVHLVCTYRNKTYKRLVKNKTPQQSMDELIWYLKHRGYFINNIESPDMEL